MKDSLKTQLSNGASPKEMVELVNYECLAACTTDNPEALRSAFDYAVDSSTRAWWMRHENRLQAAAGWRFLAVG